MGIRVRLVMKWTLISSVLEYIHLHCFSFLYYCYGGGTVDNTIELLHRRIESLYILLWSWTIQ